jgi:hypothetical protein
VGEQEDHQVEQPLLWMNARKGLKAVIRLFYSDDRFITLRSHCEPSFGKFAIEGPLSPAPHIRINLVNGRHADDAESRRALTNGGILCVPISFTV